MVTFLVILSLLGGIVGVIALLFSEGVAGTQMLAIIALACLAGILARIAQASAHREDMEVRFSALLKTLEGRK